MSAGPGGGSLQILVPRISNHTAAQGRCFLPPCPGEGIPGEMLEGWDWGPAGSLWHSGTRGLAGSTTAERAHGQGFPGTVWQQWAATGRGQSSPGAAARLWPWGRGKEGVQPTAPGGGEGSGAIWGISVYPPRPPAKLDFGAGTNVCIRGWWHPAPPWLWDAPVLGQYRARRGTGGAAAPSCLGELGVLGGPLCPKATFVPLGLLCLCKTPCLSPAWQTPLYRRWGDRWHQHRRPRQETLLGAGKGDAALSHRSPAASSWSCTHGCLNMVLRSP